MKKTILGVIALGLVGCATVGKAFSEADVTSIKRGYD
jgi:starvation-inducible outer membrane lipoprotein